MATTVQSAQAISQIQQEINKYQQCLHLLQIKKALIGPAGIELHTFLEQYMPRMRIDFNAVVANLKQLVENQKKLLLDESIDFKGLRTFYQNIATYNPQTGNIKKAMQELFADLNIFKEVLRKLWNNLLTQESQLQNLQNFWLQFKGAIAEEEKILQEEYGFIQKEKEEIKEIAKAEEKIEPEEPKQASEEDKISANIDRIISESTIYMFSNSIDIFQRPYSTYRRFAQPNRKGGFLRLKLKPGLKQASEAEIVSDENKAMAYFPSVKSEGMQNSVSMLSSVTIKGGMSGNNFYSFNFKLGTDMTPTSRTGYVAIAMIYPAEYRQYVLWILADDERRKMLQNKLREIVLPASKERERKVEAPVQRPAEPVPRKKPADAMARKKWSEDILLVPRRRRTI